MQKNIKHNNYYFYVHQIHRHKLNKKKKENVHTKCKPCTTQQPSKANHSSNLLELRVAVEYKVPYQKASLETHKSALRGLNL